jgi:hypothetical protein
MFPLQSADGEQNCEWLGKNNAASRQKKYCLEENGESASQVGNNCVASCGFCQWFELHLLMGYQTSVAEGSSVEWTKTESVESVNFCGMRRGGNALQDGKGSIL